MTKVICTHRQFKPLRRPRHVLGVDVARQSRIVAHRIERVIFVAQIPHEGVNGGEVGEVALHGGQFDRFEEGQCVHGVLAVVGDVRFDPVRGGFGLVERSLSCISWVSMVMNIEYFDVI